MLILPYTIRRLLLPTMQNFGGIRLRNNKIAPITIAVIMILTTIVAAQASPWSDFWDWLTGNSVPPVTLTETNITAVEQYQERTFANKHIEQCKWNVYNSTWDSCDVNEEHNELLNRTIIINVKQTVTINNSSFDPSSLDLWCYDDVTRIVCISTTDGNGRLKIPSIVDGESYLAIQKSTAATTYAGHLTTDIRDGVLEAIQ